MKCKKCGAELPKNAKTCPNCGLRTAKKLSTGATVAISMALILLVAALFAGILMMNRDKTPADPQIPNVPSDSATASGVTPPAEDPNEEGTDTPSVPSNPSVSKPNDYTPDEGSYTYPSANVTQQMLSTVVATFGDKYLTNDQLAYYYWYGVRNFITANADYIGGFLDMSKPLDSQYYDAQGEITWQSYFLETAIGSFEYYAAVTAAAEAEGYKAPAEIETYLSATRESLPAAVIEAGYPDLDAYLHSYFGPFASMDGYIDFMRVILTGNSYMQQKQAALSFTEEEAQEYYTKNQEVFESSNILQDGTRLVHVRHILIMPNDETVEADWMEAKQEAEDIYDVWKNNATEAYFAQLATNYSADPGSVDVGGLYANVYPGQMVPEFNNWCFDQARQPGDHTIVQTEIGFHVMYFVGYGQEYWMFCATNGLFNDACAEMEEEMLSREVFETHMDRVVLVDPVGMYR